MVPVPLVTHPPCSGIFWYLARFTSWIRVAACMTGSAGAI